MPKRNVSFTKPPEPAFIKRMKAKMGYVEPPTVETKRQIGPVDNEEGIDPDDEKPVVVALRPGDLTEEELAKETSSGEDKKIVFAKPVKKDDEEKTSLDFSSGKKKELNKRVSAAKDKTKKVKNSSLLSFEEEDDY